jgi:hypothetical protein
LFKLAFFWFSQKIIVLFSVAILGIVELVIFLLHKYYSGLNVAQEKVFADVHFTLFFTALFNAVQSCIVAFFITHRSHSLWVMPEYQDAHHYVEIREEFDRIDKELLSMKGGTESIVDDENPDSIQSLSATQRMFRRCRTDDMDNVTTELTYMLNNIKSIWRSIIQFARYPHLSYKYHDLLVQVKFHELKYHFIQENKLPITLEVSHYLKRCELRIMQRMVHINTSAWLILTACMNFLYFLMGVIAYVTDGDLITSGHILSSLFFASLIFFVFISLILWNKVTWIFHSIMHQKFDSEPGEGEINIMRSDDTGTFSRFNQKSLFWGDNPNYVSLVIQFVQFGFALALSILLVFWNDIAPKDDESGIPSMYYILCVLLCYASFVYVVAHVVPRFTLCSSIGQMVNHKELHETLARHRLKEAQRQQQRELTERNIQKGLINEVSGNFFDMMGLFKDPKERSPGSHIKPELMKELISINTSELRENLPEDVKKAFTEKDNQILDRRNRRKTLSDG